MSEPNANASLELDELLRLADELPGQAGAEAERDVGQGIQEDDEEGGSSDFSAHEVHLLSKIGNALAESMSYELTDADPLNLISDEERQEIMFLIFDKVLKAMKKKGSSELDEEDHAFMKRRVQSEVVQLTSKRGGAQQRASGARRLGGTSCPRRPGRLACRRPPPPCVCKHGPREAGGQPCGTSCQAEG